MKTAVCYYSRHHGNTLKVLQAMREIDLIDVTAPGEARLEDYDRIGFASGVYFGKFHQTVVDFARERLPEKKDIFFVCTCGSRWKGAEQTLEGIAKERRCRVLGKFGCRGYDTFGPFKLVGGIAKGRPNQKDLDAARAFYCGLEDRP